MKRERVRTIYMGIQLRQLALVSVVLGSVFLLHSAASALDLNEDDVLLVQKWVNYRKKCNTPQDGVQSESFIKCVDGLALDKSRSTEASLKILVFGDIIKEGDRLQKRALEVRNNISNGYRKDEILSKLFMSKIGNIPPESDEKIKAFFFLGSIPIISVMPIFHYSAIYYNPLVDAAYLAKFDDRAGQLELSDGYFLSGSQLRGEKDNASIAWLNSRDPNTTIAGMVTKTIERAGYYNLYEKNKKLIAKDGKDDTLGRVMGILQLSTTRSKCVKNKIDEFNSDIVEAISKTRNTNIKFDNQKVERRDFKELVNRNSGEYNLAIAISEKVPSYMVSIVFRGEQCDYDTVVFTDLLAETRKKAEAQRAQAAAAPFVEGDKEDYSKRRE